MHLKCAVFLHFPDFSNIFVEEQNRVSFLVEDTEILLLILTDVHKIIIMKMGTQSLIIIKEMIFMMKKWKRILAVAVMLALVFCAGRGSAVLVKSWQNGGLLGVNAVASTTENWGLGFGESGTQPTGNATPEELRKYNTYFIGNGDDKVIYLTFDCGYENGNTEPILDALKKHNAKATFFVVGHFLESAPDIVKRMEEEGHAVGNHTYHHPDMSSISELVSFQKEIDDVASLYQSITGKEMIKYYRPPQGKYSTENLKMAKELGYNTFFWSLAYVDWNVDNQPTKEEAFDKLLTRIHPGAIVLLHSTSKTNGEILDELLTKWEEMGYTFAPLSELIAES